MRKIWEFVKHPITCSRLILWRRKYAFKYVGKVNGMHNYAAVRRECEYEGASEEKP